LSLTGLGGWAKVLVQNCKVGALLAPMWSVNDKLARQFAEKFYDALQKPGCTLAQAARQARQALREAALHDPTAPQDPTWLAYSVYAHPNARAFFSAGT
jgi:CHAT domain-containing protein